MNLDQGFEGFPRCDPVYPMKQHNYFNIISEGLYIV